MGNFALRATALALATLLNSCIFAETSTGGGLSCGANGEYSLYGKWKKTKGYFDPDGYRRNLSKDFHIMIIEPGSSICEAEVVNNAQASDGSATRYVGSYDDYTAQKELSISYDSNSTLYAGSFERVKYKFSGGCSDPKLTLTYGDGTIEKYEIYSTNVSENDCGRFSGGGF
jgi:hypothetical protein